MSRAFNSTFKISLTAFTSLLAGVIDRCVGMVDPHVFAENYELFSRELQTVVRD